VSPTAVVILMRIQRLGCWMKLSELAQGAKVSETEAMRAVLELSTLGLVEPSGWRLTEEGKAADAP
jgi:DNA-binding IclR family transcriptional regulator